MIGFLGGFTTFSAFSLEMLNLIETNRPTMAMTYLLLSTTLGILACALGFVAGRTYLT